PNKLLEFTQLGVGRENLAPILILTFDYYICNENYIDCPYLFYSRPTSTSAAPYKAILHHYARLNQR
ncbi:MAG: hypothetical protein ABII27_05820, partial [bacterium]